MQSRLQMWQKVARILTTWLPPHLRAILQQHLERRYRAALRSAVQSNAPGARVSSVDRRPAGQQLRHQRSVALLTARPQLTILHREIICVLRG
mgnify:CR=1 FL=1